MSCFAFKSCLVVEQIKKTFLTENREFLYVLRFSAVPPVGEQMRIRLFCPPDVPVLRSGAGHPERVGGGAGGAQ